MVNVDAPDRIEIDGKYTVIVDPLNFRALRYGEEWRDLCGDGLVFAMAQEILELQARLTAVKADAE